MDDFLLSKTASEKVKELLDEGWEFMLHYGNHSPYCPAEGLTWEADFTRKKHNGRWDNHKSGYGLNPDVAIAAAYYNIKNGLKL